MGFSELFSFTVVMLIITWLNRLLNTSTSGRWISLFLLLVSFSPLIIQIDKVAEKATFFLDEPIGGNFNFDYNYTIFGILYASLFAIMTLYYQNSFHYAITSDAVIFELYLLTFRVHTEGYYSTEFPRLSLKEHQLGPFSDMLQSQY